MGITWENPGGDPIGPPPPPTDLVNRSPTAPQCLLMPHPPHLYSTFGALFDALMPAVGSPSNWILMSFGLTNLCRHNRPMLMNAHNRAG